MQLTVAQSDVLNSDQQNIGFFFKLETAPPVRFWLGSGMMESGVSAVESVNATYLGFGQLVDVPAMQQLLNGQAERVEIGISGVSAEMIALAGTQDAALVKNKRCFVGLGIMSKDWQLYPPVLWIRNYRCDFLTVRRAAATTPDGPSVQSVVLSLGSNLTMRRRPGLSYFTDGDQKEIHPTDRFCERTSIYSQQVTKPWPSSK